eukprot:2108383-Rhodomonas_salina.2
MPYASTGHRVGVRRILPAPADGTTTASCQSPPVLPGSSGQHLDNHTPTSAPATTSRIPRTSEADLRAADPCRRALANHLERISSLRRARCVVACCVVLELELLECFRHALLPRGPDLPSAIPHQLRRLRRFRPVWRGSVLQLHALALARLRALSFLRTLAACCSPQLRAARAPERGAHRRPLARGGPSVGALVRLTHQTCVVRVSGSVFSQTDGANRQT